MAFNHKAVSVDLDTDGTTDWMTIKTYDTDRTTTTVIVITPDIARRLKQMMEEYLEYKEAVQ